MQPPPAAKRTADLAGDLRATLVRFTRRLRRERADHGLTVSQLSVLGALETDGPMTPRELADVEQVQPPSMTRTVAALEERGLVRREPHASDGRQVILAATDDGVALVRVNRRAREAWLARQLAALTPAERATLAEATAILDRLTRS